MSPMAQKMAQKNFANITTQLLDYQYFILILALKKQ